MASGRIFKIRKVKAWRAGLHARTHAHTHTHRKRQMGIGEEGEGINIAKLILKMK
jgi:hypothetical protein